MKSVNSLPGIYYYEGKKRERPVYFNSDYTLHLLHFWHIFSSLDIAVL